MLRPRRKMFAAPAASSRACTLWRTLSNSAARAFEARKSADGIRTRSPFVAISGMRLSFVAISPTRRPFDNTNPEAPAVTSAGISKRNPHGIAVLTAVTSSFEPNNSVRTVENQKVAIVRMGDRAGDRVNDPLHATQMPLTATFWNRCGEAMVELG